MTEDTATIPIPEEWIKEDEWRSGYTTIKTPELSDWKCYLFGSNMFGIVWRPEKGKEPNWFWRKMQYLFFGNRWVYEPEQVKVEKYAKTRWFTGENTGFLWPFKNLG